MMIFLGFVIFAVGLVVGSFLNVCIYRLPRGNFFSSSRSFCPHCGEQLRWFDMFPIVSYIVLKGRCRHCHERISLRYPIVEGMNAVIWTVAYVLLGLSTQFVVCALCSSICIVLSFIDLDIKEVPTGVLIALLVVAIAVFVLSFFEKTNVYGIVWWNHLVGAFVISAPLFVLMLITRGGIGGGDIRLMFILGLLLGYKLVLVSFLFGIIVAAIAAIILVASMGKTGKFQLPLVPFLSIGYVIASLFGEAFINGIFG